MGWEGTVRPKLKIPRYPTGEDAGHYRVNSLEEKRISDYAGLNMREVWNLDVITYWALLRDAVIYDYMQTEEGREYLYNCWRMDQTKPDRGQLREHFGKEETNGK